MTISTKWRKRIPRDLNVACVKSTKGLPRNTEILNGVNVNSFAENSSIVTITLTSRDWRWETGWSADALTPELSRGKLILQSCILRWSDILVLPVRYAVVEGDCGGGGTRRIPRNRRTHKIRIKQIQQILNSSNATDATQKT